VRAQRAQKEPVSASTSVAQPGTAVAVPVLPAAELIQAQPPDPTAGQDSDSKSSKASSPDRSKPAASRLPRHYARLELDDEQTKQVLAIQQKFVQREALLQRQLSELQSERDQELKKVLNRAQQRKLSQLMERPRS
jgi:hypothetical protein